MNIGMRQIEGTPKRVANLTVEAHANHAECRAGEPSAIERRRARADVVRRLNRFRKALPDCPDRLLRHQRRDGIGLRSEAHTSELQSLMRISSAVFCLKN